MIGRKSGFAPKGLLPESASGDATHLGLADRVSREERRLGRPGCEFAANLAHVAFGQLRPPIAGAFPMREMAGATLANHVGHVVPAGSKEEMVGANARGIVAVVADVQPIGDRSLCKCPRNAVGVALTSIPTTKTDAAVAAGVPRTCPLPAGVGLSDLRPESSF